VAVPLNGDNLAFRVSTDWRNEQRLEWWHKGQPFLTLPIEKAASLSSGTAFSHDGRALVWGTDTGSVWLADLPALEREVRRFVESLPRE
jgi:hypothetical protein